jgi:hypothetical protein
MEFVAAGKPLPVNPYGQAREEHGVVRYGDQNPHFYGILKRRIDTLASDIRKNGIREGGEDDEIHFLVSNLVRSGLFGLRARTIA